jgi:hypothetical protein
MRACLYGWRDPRAKARAVTRSSVELSTALSAVPPLTHMVAGQGGATRSLKPLPPTKTKPPPSSACSSGRRPCQVIKVGPAPVCLLLGPSPLSRAPSLWTPLDLSREGGGRSGWASSCRWELVGARTGGRGWGWLEQRRQRMGARMKRRPRSKVHFRWPVGDGEEHVLYFQAQNTYLKV